MIRTTDATYRAAFAEAWLFAAAIVGAIGFALHGSARSERDRT
ncbi:hypothetical protein [Curtobacterium flaccumfaciens]|nr:hypothetical protein [Curtobacterium flaccumfaciens]